MSSSTSILILGLVMTLYTSFTKDTTESVVHMGPLHITEEHESTVHWQPYTGIGLMVVGGAAFLFGRKGLMAD